MPFIEFDKLDYNNRVHEQLNGHLVLFVCIYCTCMKLQTTYKM